ncbi:hypothetical protein GM418_10960 [Maribellus comscasis]|uniref:Uncharacterized protein n=1 Tax=Maribellus comscasis TaxID=2681766 RepID=A0A6I6JSE9_9BACT|nr:hypothetical protein [Maribellus comscasis]QGY44159.1 hypothetical protein GM418_10960 [Maribellus comscasis]
MTKEETISLYKKQLPLLMRTLDGYFAQRKLIELDLMNADQEDKEQIDNLLDLRKYNERIMAQNSKAYKQRKKFLEENNEKVKF